MPSVHAEAISRWGRGSPPRRWAARVRERYSRAALAALPRRQAALLLGMTDGDTSAMDDQTVEDFRTTGMAHLVAVSGQNVAILLALVTAAGRVLAPRSRRARVVVAVVGLAAFAFLTGLEASVLRAVVTAGLVMSAAAAGRRSEALRMTAICALVLLITSPSLVVSPGFQLSFAATLGLIAWATPLSSAVTRALGGGQKPGAGVRLLGEAVGTTVAAQAAVAPLLAASFGRLPAVGGLANVVAVPLAPAITVLGLVTLSAASVTPALAWTPLILRLPLDVILFLARTFSILPAASFAADGVVAVALTCALAAAVWRRNRLALVLAVVSVAAGGVTVGRRSAAAVRDCRGNQVRVLDVGQGSAVLLRAGPASVLVDAGPAGAGVVNSLRAAGVRRLDLLVVTHPHADHARGFVEVLERMPVAAVAGPPTVGWGVGREVVAAAAARRVPVRTVRAGDVLTAETVRIEVVGPGASDVPDLPSPDRIDRFSLILVAKVGGLAVVVPGDADLDDQAEAVASGRDLSADVLVAVHHGSANVSREFVEAVHPKLTLVPVGAGNRYGHPTRRALRLYGSQGPVLRTDLQGALAACRTRGRLKGVTAR